MNNYSCALLSNAIGYWWSGVLGGCCEGLRDCRKMARSKPKRYLVGTSGWHYDHWQGNFYPHGLARAKWLGFYAERFSTVEINSSFYHLPSEKAFSGWKECTPTGFIFSVKVSRFITHIRRLKDAGEAVDRFMERARLLGARLGVLLYQLPGNMKRDIVLLEDFLKILPAGLRHVFEFRHVSWFDDGIYDLLRRHRVGICIYDMPGYSSPVTATADFAYVRFHGSRMLYGGCYQDEELERWAEMIRRLNADEVYVYFNNDAGGFALQNALTLRDLLGSE